MRIGALLFVVEDWPDDERRFHVAEGILGARQQSVDAPDLIGGEVFAVGLEQITAIELFGGQMFVSIERRNEGCGFFVMGETVAGALSCVDAVEFGQFGPGKGVSFALLGDLIPQLRNEAHEVGFKFALLIHRISQLGNENISSAYFDATATFLR